MTSSHRLGDLEICAFTDGELDAEATQTLQNGLAGDEAARATAAWQKSLNARLHETYDGVLTEQIPARTSQLLRRTPRWVLPGVTRRIAASVAIAALAALAGYAAAIHGFAGGGGEAQMAQLALGAHQIYAKEIEHPVEVAGSDSAHLEKWLGKRLGIDFAVPNIVETGFKLVGGRLLAEGDKPAALLMYEDGTGRRISLFIEKWSGAGETSMRLASTAGLNSYYWIDSPLACAVSGDLAGNELRDVAQRMYSALSKA
jgi:anti-sigma factor RsiW